MKARFFVVAVVLCATMSAVAQQNDPNAPATKEDIAQYFSVVHSQESAKQIILAMLKPMHQMIHDRYLKDKDKLPSDFEQKELRTTDEMFKNMPLEEMMQATEPVYQRHFTKGDIDSLVAFYTSPTGAKLLRELPSIMGEAMEAMTPIMERYVDTIQHRVDDEFAQALKDSEKKAN